MEQDEKEAASSGPLKELEIRLTEDEIYTCLKKTFHRNEKTVWVESVVLLLVLIYSMVGFLTDAGHAFSSLGVAVAALAILAVIWLVPLWHCRFTARRVKEEGPVMKMKIYDDCLAIGEGNGRTVGFQECQPILCGDLLILSIGAQAVGIPRRLAGEDGWNLLAQKFQLGQR